MRHFPSHNVGSRFFEQFEIIGMSWQNCPRVQDRSRETAYASKFLAGSVRMAAQTSEQSPRPGRQSFSGAGVAVDSL
jgi:hypothetical protein